MTEDSKQLSEREQDTLRLLLVGHDAKSIAGHLGVSVHTVNDRLREARRKLGVSSSRQAARLLAQAECAPPNILGHTKFGMAGQELRVQQPERIGPLMGQSHRVWWLTGGSLVIFVIAAAAILSMNGMEGSSNSFGRATQSNSPAPGSINAARAGQAQNWLRLVDRQDWSESWREAGKLFRSQISANGWASAIVPVREPLGAVISRSLVKVTMATSLSGAPVGEYEILEFRTNFAAKRGAVETVILAKEQSAWKVNGYFIR